MINTKAKVKTIPFLALLIFMLASCEELFNFNSQRPTDTFDTLKEGEFYAQNMVDDSYYKVEANKLWESNKCVVWAEKGSGVTQPMAQEIAQEYETKIRPSVMEQFGLHDFPFTYEDTAGRKHTEHFDDILDFANWLVGGSDKKLTILLLDIKDGFNPPRNTSYVAGYFFSGNFYPPGKITGYDHYSNGRDMIYVDTYPGLSGEIEDTYATFAHELQHLVNYATTIAVGRSSFMDTWVDEGLSSQAEYFYLGENLKNRCEWFSEDLAGTIAQGNNFFVWNNHKENSLAILDDYATVYLFFRWLYLNAGDSNPGIFKDIITSNYFNHQAITNVAGEINSEWGNWRDLLRTWLAANYYPKNPYGYIGDDYLQKTIKVNPISGRNSISLYPGEGVYSIINSDSFTPATSGTNIRYAGITNGAIEIDTSSPYTGDVLLTFNANTSNNSTTARAETGSLTGVSVPVPRVTAAESTQTQTGLSRPYRVDARDLLGRGRELELFRNMR